MMLSTLLKTLLLPPTSQIILVIGGLWLKKRYPSLGRGCLFLGLISLWLLSVPLVSSGLHYYLDHSYPSQPLSTLPRSAPEGIQVIVVLGAGRHYGAQEYGSDTVNQSALWRLRYGAFLAKRWNLPIMISGGTVRSFEMLSEAEIAVDVLANELGVTSPIWKENSSRNTWENAHYTQRLLQQKGITKVALVTHGYHMRRSAYAFDQAGIEYVPMPTGLLSTQAPAAWWRNWLPSSSALGNSYLALHEYLGLIFYQVFKT